MNVANEVGLLLASARVRLEAGDRRALEDCLARPLNWARVFALSEWHGLTPLLARHLVQAGPGVDVPRPVQVELLARAEGIARGNRAMRIELGRILARLAGAGIDAMPYKGPTLALRAYGDLSLREFGDLDLLVAREHVQRARDLLFADGYEREYALEPAIEAAFLASSAQYHLVVRSREQGHLVELHWKSDPDHPVERLTDPAWWSLAQRIEGTPTLPDEELVLLLCIHGSKHAWTSLGWLVDVAELMRGDRPIDWSRVATRAASMGCSRRVGVALRLASDLLAAPVPPACLDLVQRPNIGRISHRLQPAMLAREPRLPTSWENVRLHGALGEHWGEGIRAFGRAVFTPSLVEWTRWPLPRALFFAYPALRIVRLVAKYLRRGFETTSEGRKLHT